MTNNATTTPPGKNAPRSIAALNPEIAADLGHEFEILAAGKPTGMFLSVVGKESSTYKRITRAQINEARKAEFARQRSGKPEQPSTIEDDIARSIEMYGGCVTGWRGVVIEESEGATEFTPDNVKRLLAYDFVRIQVEKEILGLSDFTPG